MSSIDPVEIARFSSHAAEWWDPNGALRPLHRLNPVRIAYARDHVCAHFKRPSGAKDALKGLSWLDVGCGGGLLCEPLARLGASVTGLDASAEAIEAARAHAQNMDLTIDYRCGAVEEMEDETYDVISALEILEHVTDPAAFLHSVAQRLKPNGILLLSTLNRSAKGFLLGIVAAEYILRWVPRGTHDWRKFIRPSELQAMLKEAGLEMQDLTGMRLDPLNGAFCLTQNIGVNYLSTACRTSF